MSLNIKSREAHALARQVADRTGESLTLAVTVALKDRLEHLMRTEDQKKTAQQLLAIGRRCASALDRPKVDHATLLYDEHGAPK
jgi:antitoxin VapB